MIETTVPASCLGPGQIPPPGMDNVQLIDDTHFLLPTECGSLNLTGCVAVRALPDERLLAVQPLLFGQARLCVGRPAMMALDAPWGGWDDQWEYPTVLAAVAAMSQWEPGEAEEPSNWTRHPPSGRRRKEGDPAQEEIRR